MRELATIQRVIGLRPIEGADRIEVAIVKGWECVVSKADNIKPGDLVVYIEIDSIVPDKPIFAFLKDRKFRVRTIKLRGQISQGLILPVSILKDYNIKTFREGDDVTEVLGIKKYDPEAEKEQRLLDEKARNSKNKLERYLNKFSWYRRIFVYPFMRRYTFPSFIHKTDEERIQNRPQLLYEMEGSKFIATEKIDGQSATYFLVRNKKKFFLFGKEFLFGVCSRNYQLKEDNSTYWRIAKQFNIEKVLERAIASHSFVYLQGEIIGEGIQGNKYGINGLDFYAFNFGNEVGAFSQSGMELELFKTNIKSVPIVYEEFLLKPTIPENVELAKGKSCLADIQREGIVVRNYSHKISFKIINPDFLLKYEE